MYSSQTLEDRKVSETTETAGNFFMNTLPEILNKYRIVPRIFGFTYLWIVLEVIFWFIALPSPTMAQATVVSAFGGSFVAMAGLYSASGVKRDMAVIGKTEITTYKPKAKPKLN